MQFAESWLRKPNEESDESMINANETGLSKECNGPERLRDEIRTQQVMRDLYLAYLKSHVECLGHVTLVISIPFPGQSPPLPAVAPIPPFFL